MAASLKITKICVLLTGTKVEGEKGLEVLGEEFKTEQGRAMLSAFLDVSPMLKEVTKMVGGVNQNAALKTLKIAMEAATDESRLFPVVHHTLTEHTQLFVSGLAGERGKPTCQAVLEYLTGVNCYAPSLLHHRLRPVIKGPWVGPEAAWKKKRHQYDKNLRKCGLEYLLSYTEAGDDVAKQNALGCQGFLQALCSTLYDDGEDVRVRVVEGVAKLVGCVGVARSKRAFAFERNGVADVVVNLTQTSEKIEEILTQTIVPALSVPEVPYDLTASIIPNQVLLTVLRASSPHKYISHRRVLRRVLTTTPSLSLPYLNHLKDTLQTTDPLSTIAFLDVIISTLESPLPTALCRGYLYADGTEGDSFHLTPTYVADMIFPAFVGAALSTLLKNSVQLVVLQALEAVMLGLKRLRGVVRALKAIEVRQKTFQDGNDKLISVDEFVNSLRRTVGTRFPHAGVFLNLKIASEPTKADLFKAERLLTVLRMVQIELPMHLSGVNLLKLFTAPLQGLSHTAAMLLLQLLSHDDGIRAVGYFSVGDRDVTPLAEIVSFYHYLDGVQSGAARYLRDACVIAVHCLMASVLVIPSLEKVTRNEVVAWMDACSDTTATMYFNNCMQKLYNDILSMKNPLMQKPIPGSPLTRIAERESTKNPSTVPILNTVKENLKKTPQPSVITAKSTPSKWGCYTPMVDAAGRVAAKVTKESKEFEEGDVRGYGGTLSKKDQEMWEGVREKLPDRHYQAGPHAPENPTRPDHLWTQTLASSLGDKMMQHTLQHYPTDPSAVGDDGKLIDPRYLNLVLAAHLALCASRTPPTVPELRRLTLQGFIPFIVKGLSSRDEEVRECSYTSLGALYSLTPSSSPCSPVLEHIKNSCWSQRCRVPNSVTGFLSAACEAVYRPGNPSHQAVTRYLLKFPYTRRGDWPFAENVVVPEKTGAVQMFAMQVAQNVVWSMGSGKCGMSIGSIVKGGVMQGCLTVLMSPLCGERVRDGAVKTLAAGMAVIPGVMLVQLRMLVPVVNAACGLLPSASGIRTVVVKKNWEHRARLLSMISIALLNVDENFDKKLITWDLQYVWKAAASLLASLGEEVTSDAAILFSSGIVMMNIVSSVLETPPHLPKSFSTKIKDLQQAHQLTDAPPSKHPVEKLLETVAKLAKQKETKKKDKKDDKKRKREPSPETSKRLKRESYAKRVGKTLEELEAENIARDKRRAERAEKRLKGQNKEVARKEKKNRKDKKDKKDKKSKKGKRVKKEDDPEVARQKETQRRMQREADERKRKGIEKPKGIRNRKRHCEKKKK